MIFRINFSGYVLIEADSPEEALDMAHDDNYCEKFEQFGIPIEDPDCFTPVSD